MRHNFWTGRNLALCAHGCLHASLISGFLLSSEIALRQAEARELDALEEIVVTARKRAESMQSVPVSIATFSQETIRKIGANSLRDIESSAPGLSFSGGSRRSSGQIGIRGVADDSRNIGVDARVGVYVDGVYVGRSHAVDQSLLGVERVEVLRGPQGTLFGKNTVSGAINIVTRKPSLDFEGEAEAEYGRFDYQKLGGRVNLPLLTDKVALALSAARERTDGYYRNIFLDRDTLGLDRVSGRAQLRVMPNDRLDIALSFDGLDENNPTIIAEALSGLGFALAPNKYEVAHDVEERDRREYWGVSGTIEYSLPNEHALTSITAYRESNFDTVGEEDYTPFFVARAIFNEDNRQFSQELRLSSPKAERYDYILGLYYFDERISTDRGAETGPLFPIPNSHVKTPGVLDVRSMAAFVHGNYRIDDHVELTAGIRYTHEKKRINYSIEDTTGLFVNIDQFEDQLTASDLSPRGGINYHIHDDLMLYASVSRAFKSGGWNADFITTLDQISYREEKVMSYEVGLKSTFLEGRGRLNLAGFVAKFDDFQVFQFVPTIGSGTILTMTNAGKVTSQGIELDFTIMPIRGLTLTTNAAYMDASFDQFKNGGGIGIDYDGNRLPFAPKWKTYAAAEYVFPVGDMGSILIRADFSHTGKQATNPNNLPVNALSGYEIVNGRIGFIASEQGWEVFLWGKNLTNGQFLTNRSVSFLGIERGIHMQPRTIGGALRLHF